MILTCKIEFAACRILDIFPAKIQLNTFTGTASTSQANLKEIHISAFPSTSPTTFLSSYTHTEFVIQTRF